MLGGRIERALEEIARIASDQVVVASILLIGNGAVGLFLVKVRAPGGSIVGPDVGCRFAKLLPLLDLDFFVLIDESWVRRGAGAIKGANNRLLITRFDLPQI